MGIGSVSSKTPIDGNYRRLFLRTHNAGCFVRVLGKAGGRMRARTIRTRSLLDRLRIRDYENLHKMRRCAVQFLEPLYGLPKRTRPCSCEASEAERRLSHSQGMGWFVGPDA